MQVQAAPASADGSTHDEVLYMAHEYCDGGNLEQATHAGAPPLPRTLGGPAPPCMHR